MGEGDGPFDAASREDHLPCPHMPKALDDAVWRSLARLGKPFAQRHEIVIPISRRCGACEDAAPGGGDARGGGVDPCLIQFLRITDERRTQDAVLLDKDDALARLSGLKRRRQPRWPCADHQHITECRTLGKAIGISLRWGVAQTGCTADKVFVDHPALGRAEEGFVVKTSRQESRDEAEDGTNVERKARPTVLTFRDKPVINKDISRTGVGFGASTFADSDKRVGFLDARRHDPARAVIFETAPD